MTITEIRRQLDRIHSTSGWDFAIKIETAAHCAWSAEIRVTPHPHREDGPDRSFVVFATGGLSPAAVLSEAYEDLRGWLKDDIGRPESAEPCRYCEDPDKP